MNVIEFDRGVDRWPWGVDRVLYHGVLGRVYLSTGQADTKTLPQRLGPMMGTLAKVGHHTAPPTPPTPATLRPLRPLHPRLWLVRTPARVVHALVSFVWCANAVHCWVACAGQCAFLGVHCAA